MNSLSNPCRCCIWVVISLAKPDVCPRFGLARQLQVPAIDFQRRRPSEIFWPDSDDDLSVSEGCPTSREMPYCVASGWISGLYLIGRTFVWFSASSSLAGFTMFVYHLYNKMFLLDCKYVKNQTVRSNPKTFHLCRLLSSYFPRSVLALLDIHHLVRCGTWSNI